MDLRDLRPFVDDLDEFVSDVFASLNMTLDNEAVTVTYPTVESRFSWAALGRVVETPEVWYVMFGRVQAITIPKDAMTEPQRAEFAAFVRTLQNAR